MRNPIEPPTGSACERSLEQSLSLKLWVVLSRARTSLQRVAEADMARHNLSSGEFGIMEALYHKGPLLLGEVQRKLLISSGGVTYLMDRLTEQGLVERRDCPNDRRARYAALTARGAALMEDVFPQHAQAIEDAMAKLTNEEKRVAIDVLRKLGLSLQD